MLDKTKRYLVVGLGLLGGKYALELTRAGFHVDGINRSEGHLQYALEHGYIASGKTHDFEDLVRQADQLQQLHGALLDLFEFGFREPARVGDCRVNVVTLLLGEVFYTKRGVQTAAERQNHFLLGFHDILFFCFFIHTIYFVLSTQTY